MMPAGPSFSEHTSGHQWATGDTEASVMKDHFTSIAVFPLKRSKKWNRNTAENIKFFVTFCNKDVLEV